MAGKKSAGNSKSFKDYVPKGYKSKRVEDRRSQKRKTGHVRGGGGKSY